MTIRLTTLLLALSTLLTPSFSFAKTQRVSVVNRRALAARVRAEFLHAWRGYERYAWGHDELKPLSKTARDWYDEPLYMTQVDALDTLILMGFRKEADRDREFVVKNLNFDKDIYVQNFEITIRHLGGLLSTYQLTGDRRLLRLAEDLGNRLLPAFDSPTGLPYRFVNLRTGKTRGEVTNPAEAGTLLIEFGTLSKLTRRPVFYDKAKRALVETFKRRSAIGLVGSRINVETGEWAGTTSHISGGIDSYYEYLLKCWRLFGDEDCRRMWLESIAAVNGHLADDEGGELWYGQADMRTGRRTATSYGALDAFFPAVLALSGDLARARRLQASSLKMWRAHGIEPERLDYRTMQVSDAEYPLRPEIVESAYYLHTLTGDPRYLGEGAEMFEDFVRHCKTDAGYAALKSVETKEQEDSMESFLFAETFKYFYLLFAPPKTLDFNQIIFNTEAHPIRKTWRR
ncbi:MAG: glycoside hydrolase family 47 protein [Acidobacteria bacterium]|nr:glycoside hydrolase family 47 protein [Acidobacteriota bacterium]